MGIVGISGGVGEPLNSRREGRRRREFITSSSCLLCLARATLLFPFWSCGSSGEAQQNSSSYQYSGHDDEEAKRQPSTGDQAAAADKTAQTEKPFVSGDETLSLRGGGACSALVEPGVRTPACAQSPLQSCPHRPLNPT
jgi:hypothetical protein